MTDIEKAFLNVTHDLRKDARRPVVSLRRLLQAAGSSTDERE